jgi:hypothetical protein
MGLPRTGDPTTAKGSKVSAEPTRSFSHCSEETRDKGTRGLPRGYSTGGPDLRNRTAAFRTLTRAVAGSQLIE